MTINEAFQSEIREFEEIRLSGIPSVITSIKKDYFFGTSHINTIIVIGNANSKIDKSMIESFSKSSFLHVKSNNGKWARNLNSGIGVISILIGDEVKESAIDFCENYNKVRFSAIEIPVIYDKKTKQVYRFKKYPIWGLFFYPYFKRTILEMVEKIELSHFR